MANGLNITLHVRKPDKDPPTGVRTEFRTQLYLCRLIYCNLDLKGEKVQHAGLASSGLRLRLSSLSTGWTCMLKAGTSVVGAVERLWTMEGQPRLVLVRDGAELSLEGH